MSTTVLWLTVESCRFDETMGTEAEDQVFQHVSDIAEGTNARSFDRCFSHGIYTRPSVASILTGLYPGYHGAGMDYDTVPSSIPTVAERFRNAGYATACFSPNGYIGPATDLERGFEDYVYVDSSSLHEVAGYSGLAKYLLQLRRHSGGYTTDRRKYSLGYLMSEGIKRYLEDIDDPALLYAHFGDPHHPYAPPLPFIDRYTDDLVVSGKEAREIALDMSENLFEHVTRGAAFSEREWDAIRAMYRACLAYVDELLGELHEFAREQLDDVVIVITGDHGELFGERGLLPHRLVTHDAVSHVPLVVEGPTGLVNYEGHVQHADVMRTLLEENGGNTRGLQGQDLRRTTREYSIIQRGKPRTEETIEKLQELNPEYDADWIHRGRLDALRTDQFKYERSESHRRLYELPDESSDIADERVDLALELDDVLNGFLDDIERNEEMTRRETEISGQMKERLQDMGYLVE